VEPKPEPESESWSEIGSGSGSESELIRLLSVSRIVDPLGLLLGRDLLVTSPVLVSPNELANQIFP